ncbi:MAG: T9SS type A sorting domain-containing protein [Bacteroidetes bacterium]|nr:T9SS type A sorting domain-containing protein [Bacteroidota bacterium]
MEKLFFVFKTQWVCSILLLMQNNVLAQSCPNPPGGVCDGVDNRTMTINKAIGRMYDGSGGTAWLTKSGLMVTAGHTDLCKWVEFNVKPSIGDDGDSIGYPQRSKEEDRYEIDQWIYTSGNRNGYDAGYGNDWAVFSVKKNAKTGLYPLEAQKQYLTPVLASSLVIGTIRITGYGQDGPPPPDGQFGATLSKNAQNLTLQTVLGTNIVTTPDNVLKYKIDTQHGASGSPIFEETTGLVIGIHTHSACNMGGSCAPEGNCRGTKIHQEILDKIIPLSVKVDQLNQDDVRMVNSEIGRWDYKLNDFTKLYITSTEAEFKTSNSTTEILKGYQNFYGSEKYHKWLVNFTDDPNVENHHKFDFTGALNNTNYTSKFRQSVNATIQSQILENSAMGGYLNFKDPWLIDYYDENYGYSLRNQGSLAPYKSVAYSQYNLGLSSLYKGVFLNQANLSPQSTYYSIQAPMKQIIQGIQTYFVNWANPVNANLLQADQNPIGYDQKAIIFTDANAVVTANYKASFASNNSAAIQNSGQRKLARTTNPTVLHMVYESLGSIWYETSTDEGATWNLMNGNQPLGSGTRPAIACEDQSYADAVVIVFQSGSTISVKCFTKNAESNTFSFLTQANNIPPGTITPQFMGNPVVSIISDNTTPRVMVVWEGYTSVVNPIIKGLKYWSALLSTLNFNFNSFDNEVVGNITGPSINSSNPTLAGHNNVGYQLAWQEGTNSIWYKAITIGLSQGTAINVSEGDGYSENYKPSIIAVNNPDYPARLSWVGKRYEESGGGEFNKATIDEGWKYRTIFTDPLTPGTFWSFGETVNSTNININKNDNGYIVAWSKSNGANEYTRNSSLGTSIRPFVKNTSTIISGKDVQVISGSSFSDMYGLMLNTQSLPYTFIKSDNVIAMGKEQSSSEIFSGREGVVSNGNAQFYFTLGDVTVDGMNIEFEEKTDSVVIDTRELMNQYLITKPFTLNNQSNFLYGVVYGITDSAACADLVSNGSIGYKVQLVNAQTGEVIGEFDNISYTNSNVFQYQNIGYQVNTEGIGTVTVRLKLVVESTVDAQYRLGNKHNTESITALGKTNGRKKQVGYQGSLAVKEFTLSQNYPNPFNPTTTINYALPKATNVSLKVYDVLGKEVVTLVGRYQESGRYTIEFDASKVSSGMYIYKLKAGDYTETKKMMLIK